MSDLPRLLLCSFDVIPGPSGSSRRLTEYLKALPDRFNVVVLSVKTPDHSHIVKYEGARLLRVPVGSGDLASRIQAFERAVRRQLESEEYSLVHFTDPFGGYALCEQKGDYGYKLIYEAQTFPSMEMRYTHPQTEGDRKLLAKVRRQELFCLMSSDRVITGSQTTRSYIQGLGVGEDSVRVVRAPVDLGAYVPEALGVPDGNPLRLMYLGSQLGYQGLHGLVRALALAVKQVDVRLTVVGARHADWQPHLEELVSELGLQQRVEFQPPVPHEDVAKVLALADVGVMPLEDSERNQQQGGPLAKASEYFAAARPVLTADLPITRELLPSSATVFYPPGDTQALAERIVELARDVARRTSLGRAGRFFAEQKLEAGVIRGQLLDIYDELLGRGTPAVATASLQPVPTTVTGTPTNRILQMAPPGDDAPAAKPAPAPAAAPVPASPAPAAVKQEPPQDELPLLLGQVLDEGLDTRLIKTEPDARPSEPPVVMGLPLRDAEPSVQAASASTLIERSPAGRRAEPPASPPVVRIPQVGREQAPVPRASVSSTLDELLAPPPVARPAPVPQREEPSAPVLRGTPMREAAPAPLPPPRPAREEPPALSSPARVPPSSRPEPVASKPPAPAAPPPLPAIAQRVPSAPSLRTPPRLGTVETPKLAPVEAPPVLRASPSTGVPGPTVTATDEEDIPEVDPDELAVVEALPEADGSADEEPREISGEEVQEAEVLEAAELEGPSGPELPASALDPWFAQLAHGYCPPEGAQFTRHTPPTNFPGRDDGDTDPSRLPPGPQSQGATRGKAS